MREGVTKPVLRDLLDRYLPKEVGQWKKVGFEVPWPTWLESEMAGFRRYRVPAKFAKGTMDLRVVLDSTDAVAAGYTLLSNEDSISLLQLSQVLCWGGGSGVFSWDLDNNGEVDVPIVCPAGPGDLKRPPR